MNKLIEIKEIGVKIGSGTVNTYSCIGTLTLTAQSIKKTKKCGAAETVVAVIVTGAGNATIALHSDFEDMCDMLGMKHGTGFGAKRGSRRPNVLITIKGADEEDDNLMIALPLAMVTSDEPTVIDVDNAGTEIDYTQVELAYRPDTNGYGCYMVAEDDLPSTITADSWMSNFNATTMALPVMS